MFRSIITIIFVLMLGILYFFYLESNKIYVHKHEEIKIDPIYPPCVQMYYYIEKYSSKYGVPKKYAYGIAKEESGYGGIFDWKYNPRLESLAGAVGPMQIMPYVAKNFWDGKKITKDDLKNDMELNVETSMKILNYLYSIHGDWKLVFGAYNTGRPMINQYSLNVYNF